MSTNNLDLETQAMSQNGNASSVPAVSRFQSLPSEVRLNIYSNLTFVECIRFASRANRQLRSEILGWGGIIQNLSDERGRYDLSEILRPYVTRYSGSLVRSIALSTSHLFTLEPHRDSPTSTRLFRIMNLLASWGCDSISKATFTLYSLELNRAWFETFSRLCASSLNHLIVVIDKMPVYVCTILHRFRNLVTFSVVPSNRCAVFYPLYRRSADLFELVEPHLTQIPEHRQNAALTDLCIIADISIMCRRLLESESILQAVQNLTRLTVYSSAHNGRPLTSRRNTIETLFVRLMEYCPRLQFIKINTDPSCINPVVHTFTQETQTGSRKIHVAGDDCRRTITYYACDIMAICCETLNEVRIESQDVRKIRSLGVDFLMPKVRSLVIKFHGTITASMNEYDYNWIPLMDLDGLIQWLPNLRRLELDSIRMNNAILRSLLRFPDLELLILTNYTTSRRIVNLQEFRTAFPGNLIINRRSST